MGDSRRSSVLDRMPGCREHGADRFGHPCHRVAEDLLAVHLQETVCPASICSVETRSGGTSSPGCPPRASRRARLPSGGRRRGSLRFSRPVGPRSDGAGTVGEDDGTCSVRRWSCSSPVDWISEPTTRTRRYCPVRIHAVGHRERVHEAAALGPDVDRGNGADAEHALEEHAVAGREVVGAWRWRRRWRRSHPRVLPAISRARRVAC